ncbi:hypothetical protein ACKXGF_02910 [Alkalibacillus sp. S2W]|uniref:class III lanthionine synthetase LanKC N-terminal domain-containing protein n=1 Tax=Alkalibacillus sp. S2W TaxID=3386553 RepID=UPI00398C9331
MNYSIDTASLVLSKQPFLISLNDYKSSDDFKVIVNSLQPKVKLSENGYFYFINSSFVRDRVSDWKIHISSIEGEAEDVLKKVASYCIYNDIGFKFLKDKRLLRLLNSKVWGRSSSGKFITVYPDGVEDFKRVIEELYQLLVGHRGPYILSDKRYKNSNILYYRYGNINGKGKIQHDGRKVYHILKPNGEVEDDIVGPYYYLPEGIEEPFPDPESGPVTLNWTVSLRSYTLGSNIKTEEKTYDQTSKKIVFKGIQRTISTALYVRKTSC